MGFLIVILMFQAAIVLALAAFHHEVQRKLNKIIAEVEQMAETTDQEAADLSALAQQVASIKQGILALEAQIASAGTVPDNVQAALDSLKAAVGDAASSLPAPPAPTA